MKGLTTHKRVGCIDLLFLCRYEGLAPSLLLVWYLGSQKLRDMLTMSSQAPRRPLPRPRRRPPPWCSRRGMVNVVKERLPSEEYCTWRGWQLGPRPQPSFFVICQVSRFVRPVGLQIFQDEESFHSAGRENGPSVMRNGLYIFKTHQTGN